MYTSYFWIPIKWSCKDELKLQTVAEVFLSLRDTFVPFTNICTCNRRQYAHWTVEGLLKIKFFYTCGDNRPNPIQDIKLIPKPSINLTESIEWLRVHCSARDHPTDSDLQLPKMILQNFIWIVRSIKPSSAEEKIFLLIRWINHSSTLLCFQNQGHLFFCK